jgi:hypothetical protein
MHCLVNTLLPELASSLIRLTAAMRAIESEDRREVLNAATDEQLLAEPAIRADVEARLYDVHAQIILDDVGPDDDDLADV